MKYAKFVKQLRKYGSVDKSWAGSERGQKILNHTIPLAVSELKPVSRPCELLCGREVVNQVVEYRKLARLPRIWLRKCASCGLYQHPVTGEMVDHRVINKYFPPRNTANKDEEDK